MANQYEYLVPRETAGILKQQAENCQNFGLTLKRYTPREVIENQDIPGKKNQKYRDGWLREWCNRFAPAEKGQTTPEWHELLRARYLRWIQMTQGAIRFGMDLRSRLMVGLGGKGSLEIGLTLDHVTGLPTIPGSALKGAARSYALLMIAEQRGHAFDPAEPEKMNRALNELEASLIAADDVSEQAQQFREAFGTQQKAGAYIFYDAVPTGKLGNRPLFAADVMTPHFSEYYRSSGGRPPHDADNPNPVSFLAVNSGVEFAFALGARSGAGLDQAAMEWGAGVLLNAIEMLGLGAKTAAGYGNFRLKE